MFARQTPWPRCWLMTDERMGDRLWEAIDRLPIGDGGVIVRHYSLAEDGRRQLASAIAAVCRRRGLTLGIAGDVDLARELGAGLLHKPGLDSAGLPVSIPVHSLADAEAARRGRASLAFVSPVHETRSHPEAKPLGRKLVRKIIQACGCPAIALGGMNQRNFVAAERDGFYGWAAIDAWLKI